MHPLVLATSCFFPPPTPGVLREQPGSTGMLVVESVVPGGPADGRLEPGDVLVRLGDACQRGRRWRSDEVSCGRQPGMRMRSSRLSAQLQLFTRSMSMHVS